MSARLVSDEEIKRMLLSLEVLHDDPLWIPRVDEVRRLLALHAQRIAERLQAPKECTDDYWKVRHEAASIVLDAGEGR